MESSLDFYGGATDETTFTQTANGCAVFDCIWSTENDPQGLFILLHWLYGGGKDCDFVEGAWGDYMRNNKRLSGFIREIAYEQAASLSAGESQEIDITTSAEIENGESIIGYQYLHGTNADVGGFRVIGSVGKTTHGQLMYSLQCTWNDIIDPNLEYASDRKKLQLAKLISRPADYRISITWTECSPSVIFKGSSGRNNGNTVLVK